MSLASWFYDLFNTPEPEPVKPTAPKPAPEPIRPVVAKLIECIGLGDFKEAVGSYSYYESRRHYDFAVGEDLSARLTTVSRMVREYNADFLISYRTREGAECRIAGVEFDLTSAEQGSVLAAFRARSAGQREQEEAKAKAAQLAAIAKIEAYVPRVTTNQPSNAPTE